MSPAESTLFKWYRNRKRQITTYFLMNELNQYNFNLSMYQSLFLRIDILELQK